MQFGGAFHRIMQNTAYANPRYGPPQVLKFDLADGFYRIRLMPSAAQELAVVFPGFRPSSTLVGIPLCLPMGWNQSPPYFCYFMETIADIANTCLSSDQLLLEHPLEQPSQNHPTIQQTAFAPTILHPPMSSHTNPAMALVDVYMDDFIAVAQPARKHNTLRCLLHSISGVFCTSPLPDDKPSRKQIISESKLSKGDGAWSTRKNILGWDVDTAAGTLCLPQHKFLHLIELIRTFQAKRHTSHYHWSSLLGELPHMSLVLQGAAHLFSILQSPLVNQPQSSRLRLHPFIHTALTDWKALTASLATESMPIASIVPRWPANLGTTDASTQGVGGIWLPTRWGPFTTPIVFRHPFPPEIQCRLVSATNPSGDLMNSDLELCALVLAAAVLADTVPLHYSAIWCGSDNTSAISWTQRGSTMSTGVNAHLLCLLAPLSRAGQFTLHTLFIPGSSNTVADFCSHSFSLPDSQFQQTLLQQYPTTPSWIFAHPPKETVSAMISTLSKTPVPWESVIPAKWHQTVSGTSGGTSATPFGVTPTCLTQETLSPSCRFSPTATRLAKYLPAALPFAAERWAMPFTPLARRSPAWVSPTPASYPPGSSLTA
jgi:hypothetical protein